MLELMKIPAFYERQLLDKFRYLQLELSRPCSIVHWSYDLLPGTLVYWSVKFHDEVQHFYYTLSI